MSLIFRALQRVGDHASVQQEKVHGTVPKRKLNSRSFRSVLFSSATVLAAVIGIIMAGLIISQSVNFFPKRMNAQTSLVQAASNEQAVTKAVAPEAELAAEEIVEPDNGHQGSMESPHDITYQVHPPVQPATMVTTAAVDNNRTPIENEIPADANSVAKTHNSSLSSPVTVESTVNQPGDSGGKNPAANDGWGSPGKETSDRKISALSMLPPDTLSPPKPTNKIRYSALPIEGRPAMSGEDPQREKISAQATRHLEISRLAKKIYSAIQADDEKLASQMIQQLSKMKGPQNNFVLKLKAYSLIRQNRLKEARTLLSQVLSRRVDDLEAGLNMAVIDIKTGRYQDARRRLINLRGLYPEEANVTHYLKQLPRSP